MFFNNIDIIERGIYIFLTSFHKTNDFHKSSVILLKKLKCSDEYSNFIISECVKANYFEGLTVTSTTNNHKVIDIRQHLYITRQGYQFLHQYRLDKFNFFWIPFKHLTIIIVTAFITAVITNLFSDKKQVVNTRNKIISHGFICIEVCNHSNN